MNDVAEFFSATQNNVSILFIPFQQYSADTLGGHGSGGEYSQISTYNIFIMNFDCLYTFSRRI